MANVTFAVGISRRPYGQLAIIIKVLSISEGSLVMKYRIRIAFPRWRLIGFRPRSPSCSLSPVSKPFMLLLRTRMGPKSLLAETFYLAWLGVLLEKYGEAHLSLPLSLSCPVVLLVWFFFYPWVSSANSSIRCSSLGSPFPNLPEPAAKLRST